MRTAVATLSGVAGAVLSALPLAWLEHGLRGCHGWISVAALAIGVMVAVTAGLTTPAVPGSPPRRFWEWLLIVAFVCASARAFLWLVYPDGGLWKILSPNNLGDLSLHLSLIRWLAATPHWWPASPILAGDPLRYPPGSDLFNALLLVAGVPPERGLIWCGLGAAALTGYALWRWGGAFALAAFLFNGGFAGTVLLKHGWSADPDAVSEWKNIFLTLFVTQRGLLFALPAGLLLLSAWRGEHFGVVRRTILPLPLQALLLGVMPIFSIHTALFLGVMMAGVWVACAPVRTRLERLALMAYPPMVLLGWLVTSGAGGPSALHVIGWQPGWLSNGAVGFWFWNFGIALPLACLLCLLLLRGGTDGDQRQLREVRAFVWPAAVVFAFCLLVRFAPWPWDNMKLMLWSWLVVAPFLWTCLVERLPFLIRAVTLILLFGSGAATLVAGLGGRHGYELIRRDSLYQAAWLLREKPAEAVIACAPEYNHPVLMTGHPIVCGYEGHLWSHGLDYKKRLEGLNSVMKGGPGWEQKARELGVSFIYWSELEAKRWPDSKLPWAKETAASLHPLAIRVNVTPTVAKPPTP